MKLLLVLGMVLVMGLTSHAKVTKVVDKFDGTVTYKTTSVLIAGYVSDNITGVFKRTEDDKYYVGFTAKVSFDEIPIMTSSRAVVDVKMSNGNIYQLKYTDNLGRMNTSLRGTYYVGFHDFASEELIKDLDDGVTFSVVRMNFDNGEKVIEIHQGAVKKLMKEWKLLREIDTE